MWIFLGLTGAFFGILIFALAMAKAARRGDEMIDGLIEANRFKPIDGMSEPIHERFRM